MDVTTETTDAAPGAPPPSPEASDPLKAKRDAAAERQRNARALRKLEKANKEAKKLAKLNAEAAKNGASPVDQPATLAPAPVASDVGSDGWPAKEAQAAMMPAACTLLGQLKFALGSTRYGQALEVQRVEVTQPDGSKAEQRVDPIGDMLAPPLAAVLAQSGARLTPGQALLSAFAFTLGPVALAHGVQLTVEYFDRRRKAGAQAVPRQAAASLPPAEATPANGVSKGAASAPVEFRKAPEA